MSRLCQVNRCRPCLYYVQGRTCIRHPSQIARIKNCVFILVKFKSDGLHVWEEPNETRHQVYNVGGEKVHVLGQEIEP